MNTIFNELDHRLSVVKRWGILHTIQTQSVAEHTFNVNRIAGRIAVEWFRITDPITILQIANWASHHDDFEALTGDLPTMVKPYFDEATMAMDHRDILAIDGPATEEVKMVVKLADMMEGYHFLVMEKRLGNDYCMNHLIAEGPRIREYIRENCPKVLDKFVLWADWISNSRSTRFSKRGR